MSYRDVVLRNQDMQQEHTVSNTKNAGGSMSMVAVLSKDIVPSEAISDTGSGPLTVLLMDSLLSQGRSSVSLGRQPLLSTPNRVISQVPYDWGKEFFIGH